MSGTDAHDAPATCENCATPLQGQYCHACGQSVHSPTRHFGHAVEEVFESFWHLDGRVFRTLRDLFVPGRVACNYLAGQRVRYIAPLRLFVILTLVTFFVGKLTVQFDESPVQLDGRESAIGRATTVAEVERIESELLKEISAAEKEAAKVPGVNAALIAQRAKVQGEAASRIVELENRQRASGSPAEAPTRASTTTGRPAATAADSEKEEDGDDWNFNGKPWDARTNPVDVPWAPGFVDRWFNRKIGKARENLDRMDANADAYVQASLGAVPGALFVLMPIFALLLKVLYLGSGRRYLEHLVVALYSHAWLLLVLLAMFVTSATGRAFATPVAGVLGGIVTGLLWLWVPIYLFVMQHRVYREHWALTAIKYLVIGFIYVILISLVIAFSFLAGLVA